MSDLSWLAGIMDGEGSIVIGRGGKYHILRLTFTNTDEGILKNVRRILTDLNLFYTERIKPPTVLTRKACSTIEVNRREEAKKLIDILEPLLKAEGKHMQIKKFRELYEIKKIRKDGRKPNTRKGGDSHSNI